MPSISKTWLPLLLYLALGPQLVTASSRFQSWFPRYEAELNHIVNNNCSSEYTEWHGAGYVTPIWHHNGRAGPLINCILTATPEIIKANFNSAAVVLGLMPALLALVGPGVRETSTLLTFGEHPLLALIICLSSPFTGVDRELHIRGAFRASTSKSSPNLGLRRSWWLTCLEYMMALAAMANIVEVTWELTIKTSFTWFKDSAFVIWIWAVIGFITHLLGALALSTCTRIGNNVGTLDTSPLPLMLNWLQWRFSFTRRQQVVHVVVQPPSPVYFLSVAVITFFTLFQIFFGTIVFSSILFIAVHNAVQVWIRFMSSVMVCRILVLMELSFIQKVVETEDAEGDSTVTQTKGGQV